MDFLELAKLRQSCRAYDETREVEPEKLQAILEAGRLAPSACNGQPYRITVCQKERNQQQFHPPPAYGSRRQAH